MVTPDNGRGALSGAPPPGDKERRPDLADEAAQNLNPTPTSTLPCPSDDAVALAARREFAIRVWTRRRDGVAVAQVFSDLGAAERKIDRTRRRGLDARAELVRLVPVVPLDDGDDDG